MKVPFGCNPDDLEGYGSQRYTDADVPSICKPWKGYLTSADGVSNLLETKNSFCKRTCKYNNEVTRTKIKCRCTRKEKVCSYQIKIKATKEWVPWKSLDDSGNPIVPYDTCVPGTTSQWNEWGSWSACSATCGAGAHVRRRDCMGTFCEGSDTESKPCLDYNSSCHIGYGKTFYPFGSPGARYHEGEYCIFPTEGWFEQQVDGTQVKVELNCSDSDHNVNTHDNYVIAGRGDVCQLVCTAENGDNYRPRAKTGSDSFTCSTPIPMEMYDDMCYRNPFVTGNEMHQQCVSDWIDQGFDLRDQTTTLATDDM